MTQDVPIAVLASGSGTNLQALLDADLSPGYVKVVIVNVPGAKALDRAQHAGVEGLLIDHKTFASREAFDTEVVAALQKRDVHWIVLAGFMRLISPVFLSAYPNRIVNIHPSLLPSFPGVHAQAQALAAGVKITGCTAHLVDAGMDTGPILGQIAVPILPDDTEVKLSRRILRQEHDLLPAVVRALAKGQLNHQEPHRVHLDLPTPTSMALANPKVSP